MQRHRLFVSFFLQKLAQNTYNNKDNFNLFKYFFLEWKKIIGKEQDLSLVKEHILISFAKVFNIKGYI